MIGLNVKLSGANELRAVFKAIQSDADAATVSATRAVQRKLATAVRSRMRGAPRWSHRGAGRRGLDVVNLSGPRNAPRGGGPGKMTGDFLRGVGGKKKLVALSGVTTGGVGIGGSRIPQNRFKYRIEDRYPFFAPAVASVAPNVVSIYETAYANMIRKRIS